MRDLTREVAGEVSSKPMRSWLWKGRHAKLVDGFTFTMPDTLPMRELRYQVVQPGYRSCTITIATTLTDAQAYSQEDIAQLYGFRWNSELDLRSIKQSLNLGHVRSKSPEMVRKELWTTLLGYNLIRTTAAAATLHQKQPRQISFTGTCQYVLASWMLLSCRLLAAGGLERHCHQMLSQIAACEVADRPGRLERARAQTSASRLQTDATAPSRSSHQTGGQS